MAVECENGLLCKKKKKKATSPVYNNIMEQKWPNAAFIRALLTGFTICVALVPKPTLAVDTYAEPEMVVQNGTTGILRCTFKSHEVVSSSTSVTWSFQSSEPNNKFSSSPYVIYYFSSGKGFPGPVEFKERIQFIGDINKRDVSIQLSPVQFSDNGTFFCDVRNPPDVTGTMARIDLRVVRREFLPQSNATLIIGAVCGALGLLVLIALTACFVMRHRTRHDYEGCTSLESVSSQAPQPRKKVESGLEGSKSTIPSGPLQGPVIYAQLDHSGSKNSFHKMEPVVYADIRKN